MKSIMVYLEYQKLPFVRGSECWFCQKSVLKNCTISPKGEFEAPEIAKRGVFTPLMPINWFHVTSKRLENSWMFHCPILPSKSC